MQLEDIKVRSGEEYSFRGKNYLVIGVYLEPEFQIATSVRIISGQNAVAFNDEALPVERSKSAVVKQDTKERGGELLSIEKKDIFNGIYGQIQKGIDLINEDPKNIEKVRAINDTINTLVNVGKLEVMLKRRSGNG